MRGDSEAPDTLFVGPRYFRAHGLGNDYLVLDAIRPGPASEARGPAETRPGGEGTASVHWVGADAWPLTAEAVRRICARGTGVGSDGVVVLLDDAPPSGEPFRLRMFNPDGSEFERSGNGLRVLGAALHARGRVGAEPFDVASGGSVIPMQVHGEAPGGIRDLSVAMGRALAGTDAAEAVGWGPASAGLPAEEPGGGAPADPSTSGDAPTPPPTTAGFTLPWPAGGLVRVVPVWVGNPHAVVFLDAENPDLVGADDPAEVALDGPLLHQVGPFLATHPAFARGTNVQLARVRGKEVEIGIWERGVGRTPASGTSSCAAAVAAVATGRRAPGSLSVRMPGGRLQVEVTEGLEVVLRGPVQEVATGVLSPGFVAYLREGASFGG